MSLRVILEARKNRIEKQKFSIQKSKKRMSFELTKTN
jgi:hypothetical protein